MNIFLSLQCLHQKDRLAQECIVGCVIVKDKFVLATGYNGSLPGLPHCEEEGCLIVDNHCVRTNHAEINALTQAVTHGVNIKGSSAYITNMSCTTCAKALIAAGIKRVVVFSDYHDTLATKFYSESDVEIVKLKMPDKIIQYDLKGYYLSAKNKKV